ncbi:hypothetical protein HCB35_05260 [Listeria booriae]|uniref:Uncharacterized protein n=1 Tax=Listeria booriae TaxID=1552123 RepID=A0A842EXR7_9LIST|nr:hypothetical protein [Listeria booriae]
MEVHVLSSFNPKYESGHKPNKSATSARIQGIWRTSGSASHTLRLTSRMVGDTTPSLLSVITYPSMLRFVGTVRSTELQSQYKREQSERLFLSKLPEYKRFRSICVKQNFRPTPSKWLGDFALY